MPRTFVSVEPDSLVAELLEILLRYRLNGVPVVDEDDALQGVVTLSDIRRTALPSPHELEESGVHLTNVEELESRFLDVVKKPVREIMTRDVVTIDPEKSLFQAVALMNARKVKQLPVVEAGNVVGEITAEDVAWAFASKYRAQL
jgi:CBS domain-containing protein